MMVMMVKGEEDQTIEEGFYLIHSFIHSFDSIRDQEKEGGDGSRDGQTCAAESDPRLCDWIRNQDEFEHPV